MKATQTPPKNPVSKSELIDWLVALLPADMEIHSMDFDFETELAREFEDTGMVGHRRNGFTSLTFRFFTPPKPKSKQRRRA